jgi:predicted amidophosphoribosyltransferase
VSETVACVVFGPYHRLESPTQTIQDANHQEQSGELWGQPARWSQLPSVKAYRGPLPTAARGIEFTTQVQPHAQTHPTLVQWYEADPGVSRGATFGFVWIPIKVTRNSQV